MTVTGDKIVVIGATGKIGRLVLAGLAELGLSSKAFSRGADALQLPILSELVIGDLADIASVERAVEGSSKVFLLWPYLSADGAQAIVAAIAKHASRIVYLSTAGAGDAADRALNPVSDVHYTVENMIRQAVPEWTFVRPYGFASNTLLWADQIRRGDTVRWPYARAQRTLVHDGDIADVIVAALTQDTLSGRSLTLSGSQTLLQEAQVALIGDVLGRPLRLEEELASVTRAQMLDWGMPLPFVDGVLGYWAKCVSHPEPVNQIVQDVTGRAPRSLRDWIAGNAEKFR
jgi:uncharacterized protein YbjT (DUF2867 family)